MRNFAILMTATALAACGGSNVESAGGLAVTGGSPTPASGTTSTGVANTVHTFVVPTEVRTYQAQAASQVYTYDYTEAVQTQKIKALNGRGEPLYNNEGDFIFVTTPQTYTLRDANGDQILDANGQPTEITVIPPRKLQQAYQGAELYQPFTSSVRAPGVAVTYDPKNAQFTLKINQNDGSIIENITFQDPAHRTDFSGAVKPQPGVPNLETGDPSTWRTKGVQYLQVSNGNSTTYDVSTFFYELPGTTTKYVTYAGFVRNQYTDPAQTVTYETSAYQYADLKRHTKLERASFVYGEFTPNDDVPKTGSATFSGNMIATMINNPEFDKVPDQSSYFQWMSGTANVTVDFAKGSVATTLSGTVLEPLFDTRPVRLPTDAATFQTDQNGVVYSDVVIPKGATFSATGAATIDLVKTGGFTGGFSAAQFQYAKGGANVTAKVDIVGGSLDGAFYGPKAAEVGASFRIVGGVPDQRVDIAGSFTGIRK